MTTLERVLLTAVAVAALVLGVLALATDIDLWSDRTVNASQNIVIGVLSLALAFRRDGP